MVNLRHRLLSFLLLPTLLSACTASLASVTPEATSAKSMPSTRVLRIYNWDTYIDPQILSDFERQQGVQIEYTTYTSNEELFEQVQLDKTAYDLIVPGDYIVARLRGEGLLTPLDKEGVPNWKNIDPAFLNPGFDPGNRYCAPYQWGTIGIGYNIKATKREIKSWFDLFDPAFAGQVAMLNERRLTLGVALLALGYSPNTSSPLQIKEAAELLMRQPDQIAVYADDNGQNLLAEGKVALAVEWSGDIFQLMQQNPDIRYAIPQEGSLIWTDSMCVLAETPNKDLAQNFINYILDPHVGATLSNFVHYSSPNQTALPFINPQDRNNPALYPPAALRERLFFLADVGEPAASYYVQAWNNIHN